MAKKGTAKKTTMPDAVTKHAMKAASKQQKHQAKMDKLDAKQKKRDSKYSYKTRTNRSRTLSTLGAEAAAAGASITHEREETRRRISDNQASIQQSLAQWQSLYGSNPTPSEGNDGSNGSSNIGDTAGATIPRG